MAKPIRNTLNLDTPSWGLADARRAAAQIITDPQLLKPLLRALFSGNSALRHRAADTARRIAEKQPELLSPYAERCSASSARSRRKRQATTGAPAPISD